MPLSGYLRKLKPDTGFTSEPSYICKLSKLRYNATPEQINCTPGRGITKEILVTLSDGTFIEKSENLLITGSTGCGKSYFACAMGRNACLLGYRTLYYSMNRFIEALAAARLDGTYLRWLNMIAKTPLLIIDDFGLQPLNHDMRLTLLQILEDRIARGATIVTSQLPVNKWYEYIKEPTLADAICDRLTSNAHKIELKGESLTKKEKQLNYMSCNISLRVVNFTPEMLVNFDRNIHLNHLHVQI